jgi:dolichol-phosphate mannosyltransferase
MNNTAGKTLVVIPTYNEIENLPSLVEEIFQVVESLHVLVIDDNSADGTGQWCDQLAATEPRLHCLHRKGKLGLGTATIAGMQYAIDHDYEFVVIMDADFSHHPRYLPDLIACAQNSGANSVDVAIGSRYISGGGVQGWPLHRKWMSRCVNFYARLMLGLSVRDCSGAFRCYGIECLRKVNFQATLSRGYSFQEEILWRLRRVGAQMEETPIIFVDRQRGTSKINSSEAWAALRILFRLGIQNWTGL